MKISPVNNISNNYGNCNNNIPNFKGKSPTNVVKNVIKTAAIPVCAFLALTPSLLSAQTNKSANKDTIQYEKEFLLEGQNYKMQYVNYDKNFGDNAVTDIYFVPKDTTLNTLRLEQLVKYNFDDDESYIYTFVSEPGFDEDMYYEMPEEINQELLDLYNGETDFFLVPGINTYSEINL